MSVTIQQHPSAISFAGNPVLLKATSNLKDKTFLKVCAEVSVSIYQRSEHKGDVIQTLSVPTEGGDKEVVFNFSDILQSALSQISIERNSVLSGGIPSFTGGYVQYSVKVWDEYLDEYSEIISTNDKAYASSGQKIAIPGMYTDMQRLLLPEDTADYLGAAYILSNKPDGEVIPLGGSVTVPVFSAVYQSVGVYVNSVSTGNRIGTHTAYASEASWSSFAPSSLGYQSLVWDGLNLPPFFLCVIPAHPFARRFEFVNRLGAVESVYTFGRAQKKVSLSQERQVRRHDMSFRPAARYVKRTLQEEETWELSTGPASREWAEWFVKEFMVSESVWMYSEKAADMVPVIIECDEAVALFNESEAEVLDLPFKVVASING